MAKEKALGKRGVFHDWSLTDNSSITTNKSANAAVSYSESLYNEYHTSYCAAVGLLDAVYSQARQYDITALSLLDHY